MTTTDTRNGLTFLQWFAKADAICEGICGLGLDDLADGPSWDRWNDGTTPGEYAREQIAENGGGTFL